MPRFERLLWAGLFAIVLAVLTAVVAFAPATAAGGMAGVLMVALAGAGLARLLAERRLTVPSPPRWAVLLAVLVLGVALFWRTPSEVRWRTGDWGPHHLLTRELAGSLALGGGIPRWVLSVSTGHSPYEMYPVATYLVAAGLSVLFGPRDVPAVLFAMGVACHVFLSLSVTRLALRLAPWPAALAVGGLALVDWGGFESGALQSVLDTGLLHAALAQCFTLTAFIAAVDYLVHPRPRLAYLIWICTALGAAFHPASLLFLAILAGAAAVTAALSVDVRPRRAALLVLHLAIGACASAWAWLPFVRRVFAYGVPFAFRAPSLGTVFEEVVGSLRTPPSSFPLLIALGVVGMVSGLIERRAAPTLTAATAALLLLSYSDAPHLLLGLADSAAFSRLQPFRFVSLARPLLLALGAHALGLMASGLRHRRRPADPRRWAWVGAVAGGLSLVLLRAVAPLAVQTVEDMRGRLRAEVPDPEGFRALVEWARTQAAPTSPASYGRLLYEGDSDSNWIDHVTAETGLPAFFLDDSSPGAVGRERMEDSSPESLRRFNVRWIAAKGRPPSIGDPGTETRLGRYFVRAWPEWDGRLARVERGAGEVLATRIENERIDVVLRGTNEPALVALGTGYYPRWRAHLEDGREIPVYAAPAVPGGWSRVPAAWLPPGRATFTPDGPLPSDGAGRIPTTAALAVAVGLAIAQSRRAARGRLLRAAASVRRALRRRKRRLGAGAAALLALAVALAAVLGVRAPIAALALGIGWSGNATVESRTTPDEAWKECDYSRIAGAFVCGEAGRVSGAAATVGSDFGPGNAYLTPAVMVFPRAPGSEFRIRATRRLEGTYAAGTVGKGVRAELRVADGPPLTLTRKRSLLTFADARQPVPLEVILSRPGEGPFGLVFLEQDALAIDRRPDVPTPPDVPPAAR